MPYDRPAVVRDPELLRKLEQISDRDPDGGELEPTTADHAAHKAWAVATYGLQVWERYAGGSWDPECDPDW